MTMRRRGIANFCLVTIALAAWPQDGLAQLVPGIDRIVVDRTGLTGTFDVDLTWNFEATADNHGVPLPPPDSNAPSLFTALQEQLGLKLESTKGPVDILVIDHAEPPTPD